MIKIDKIIYQHFNESLNDIVDNKCLKYLNKKNKIKSKKHRLIIYLITMDVYDYMESKLIHDIEFDMIKLLNYIDIHVKQYVESKYIDYKQKEVKEIFDLKEFEENTDFIEFE